MSTVTKFYSEKLPSQGWILYQSGTEESQFYIGNITNSNDPRVKITETSTGSHIMVMISENNYPDLATLKTSDPTLDPANYSEYSDTDSTGSNSEDVAGQDPPGYRPPDSVRIKCDPTFVRYKSSHSSAYLAAWYASQPSLGLRLTLGSSGGVNLRKPGHESEVTPLVTQGSTTGVDIGKAMGEDYNTVQVW